MLKTRDQVASDISETANAQMESYLYRGVKQQGYLTIRTVRLTRKSSLKSKWTRQYFILHGSNLYVYKSHNSFLRDPSKPIRMRPIDFSDYYVAGISVESPYKITLAPRDPKDFRNLWEFRCDTIAEIDVWSKAFAS